MAMVLLQLVAGFGPLNLMWLVSCASDPHVHVLE